MIYLEHFAIIILHQVVHKKIQLDVEKKRRFVTLCCFASFLNSKQRHADLNSIAMRFIDYNS